MNIHGAIEHEAIETFVIIAQRFIQEKNGSKNGLVTKIGDFKTDPSQKSETIS